MSLPAIPSSFSSVRAGPKTTMTFPFLEKGDAVTKLYKMNCSILRDSYNPAALSLNATMATAASAGVIELPFLADAAAYFCGDFNHNLTEGAIRRLAFIHFSFSHWKPFEWHGNIYQLNN